ncbi:SSI family serine proteinase inhibitor [Luteipulveratus flavus]|uniref:SSI family serine proteinase inhibitor n=1 Tax=Luteipulveratus flavus TaxID=3031728 RepID=A0ABT6CBG7_9MICO|nr:SSI family serine proteinase inhibitor [Luteipulveratus sp. YIM 133296]MDF8266235.1 SSI family serine proteinase inhibitor [Luteipulveratus sp. YIM 133296]
MSKIHRLAATAAVLATAGVSAFAGSAGASTTSTPDYVRLHIQIIGSDGHSTYGSLRCDPPAGRHHRPAEACAELAAVDGNPAALNVSVPWIRCNPQAQEPTTVRMTGYWGSTVVDYRRTFANPCMVMTTTGSVFSI